MCPFLHFYLFNEGSTILLFFLGFYRNLSDNYTFTCANVKLHIYLSHDRCSCCCLVVCMFTTSCYLAEMFLFGSKGRLNPLSVVLYLSLLVVFMFISNAFLSLITNRRT